MPLPFVITRGALKQLKKQLEYLRSGCYGKMGDEMAEAFEGGGGSWHDNFTWEDAQRRQAMHNGKITDIETILGFHVIIDDLEIDTSIVSIGTVVRLNITPPDKEVAYTILGATDAEPENNILNYQAPVIAALLGRKVGDKIHFRGREFTILEISRWLPPSETD